MKMLLHIYTSLWLLPGCHWALALPLLLGETRSLVDLVGAIKMTGDWTDKETVEDFYLT